jgi:hypothetical protein
LPLGRQNPILASILTGVHCAELPEVKPPLDRVRIFIASPSDVQQERESLTKLIDEINLVLAHFSEGTRLLEAVRWETHTHPAMGRPESVILKQIGEYDIFIGIMWRRFGTPTGNANSGTEEEFRNAYDLWMKSKRAPQILFYFCEAETAMPRTQAEVQQLGKVLAFREELESKGLVWSYQSHEKFSDVVRPHLIKTVALTQKATKVHSVPETQLPPESVERILKHGRALGRQYERIRREMNVGSRRTRKFELIIAEMRTLTPATTTVMRELTQSPAPGERLLAIAALQQQPNPDYLEWLSGRFESAEASFLQYHAGVALLTAIRMRIAPQAKLHEAAANAMKSFTARQRKRDKTDKQILETDRHRILSTAMEEVLVHSKR